MLFWLFIVYVCFFPQILGALWTWHGIRRANTCVVGTQLGAVSEHNWHRATRGSPQSQRNTTQLKTQAEATTGSRFQMCHGRAREGEKKERKEGKPRKYHRGAFTTDCTSVEEFPPRHCREVAQKTSEKGEQGAFEYEGFQIFTVSGNRWAWLSQKGSWALAQRWSLPSFQESPRSPCGTWLAGQKWTDAALLQSAGRGRDRTNVVNKNLAPAQLSSHPECQYL